MLDPLIKPRLDPVLDRIGRRLAAAGVAANAVTAAGLALGLAAAAAIAAGDPLAGLVLFLLSRLADGLDGAVARAGGGSGYGSYLDICADFVVYAAIPVAFVSLDPAGNGLAGALLLAAFYVNGATFLGFAILAERRGLRSGTHGQKGFFHAGGLLEGSETIAFLALFCLLPEHFTGIALVFAGLCIITAALRVRRARRVFA